MEIESQPDKDRSDGYDVFISYSRSDETQVKLIATRLTTESGLRVWMDRSKLQPGHSWREEIETALNSSAGALIVWGPQGLGRVQRQERDLSYSIRDGRDDFKVIYCLLPKSPPPQGNWANIDTWVQFDSGLDEPDVFAHLLAAIKGEAPPTPVIDLPDLPAPYRGLAAFGEEDARFFFGRTEYTDEIIERLKHYPFVALVGPSGSGKTSVVQAGLRPRLTSGANTGGPWQWLQFTPGPQPLHSLARALARLQPNADPLSLKDSIFQRLHTRQTPLVEIIQSYLPENTRLMLVVDRLEEIFTLCVDETERQSFIETLVSLFGLPHPPASVVVTMRADFYSHVGSYPNLANEIVNHQVYLMPMAQQNVAEIIGAPATQVGAIFEKGLANQVEIDATVGGEIVLPLLQQSLELLWRERRGRWLTWEAYKQIGRVAGALRYHAGRVIDSLNPQEQEIARRLFMGLIWLDENIGTMAGRRVKKSELISDTDSKADEYVLQRLADERLLILGLEGEVATVSLAHDTLPLHWEQLRTWMKKDRDFLLWRQRLRSGLEEWIHANRDEGSLMRGAVLNVAEDWLAARPADLSTNEKEFINESLKLRERERVARETLQRRIITGLAAGFLIAVLLSVIALVQRGRARAASQEALSSKLAALATVYSSDRLDLALLLSSEAQRAGDTQDARRIFLGGLIDSPNLSTFLHGHSRWVGGVAFSPDGNTLASCSDDTTIILWDVKNRKPINPRLTGHKDEVLSVAFSPDGKVLASGSKDGTIILWDVVGHQPLGDPLRSHNENVEGSVLSVAFSPDGKMLAAGGKDSKIVLWDIATRKPIEPAFPEQSNSVVKVTFSPDGKALATGVESEVTLWDVTNHSPTGSIATNSKAVNSIAFSPDGKTLSVGSDDNSVTLWDVSTKTRLRTPLVGHSDAVQAVAFSPDGRVLASGSTDNSVILWDVTSGEQLDMRFRAHADGVTSVAFSPDGKTLASGSRDNKVILWDVPQRNSVLKGHESGVRAVQFSPDGKLVASGSEDTRVILWNLESNTKKVLKGHSDSVNGLAFSPDGRILASGSKDGTVILWQLNGQDPESLTLDCERWVTNVAFSPDGKTLVAGRIDGEILIWDVASRERRGTIVGGKWPMALAISPDGRTLAAGDYEGFVTLWDFESLKIIDAPLPGHRDLVQSVAFSSPDGKILASSSLDKSILLWDVETRVPLSIPLTGHTANVLSVIFSPDGKTLASGSDDQTVILWDVASRRPIGRPLARHKGGVKTLAFSPDGSRLATGGVDGNIVLWELNLQFDSARGCSIANRNLSKAEWDQFIGANKAYECTCPGLPPGEGAPACR